MELGDSAGADVWSRCVVEALDARKSLDHEVGYCHVLAWNDLENQWRFVMPLPFETAWKIVEKQKCKHLFRWQIRGRVFHNCNILVSIENLQELNIVEKQKCKHLFRRLIEAGFGVGSTIAISS